MGAAAIAAAEAVGYRNAGTCEFLLEGSGEAAQFYFLEMNTRLQVEHPVTECVAGVDLVHAQLAVAAGDPLPFSQASLTQRGHAVECRIYAEDPAQGFLPQAGRLLLYREPQGPGIRIDSGVREGSDVSVHYDPMLAKLIVHAETREAARRRAIEALRGYAILGIRTNIAFLIAVLEHQAFVDAAIDTRFLDREAATIASTLPTNVPEALATFARSAGASSRATASNARTTRPDPFETLRNWRG